MSVLARVLRPVLAALVVATAATAPGSAAAAHPAQDGAGGVASAIDSDAAIDDLVGCVQGSKHLLVQFLIDQSGSLTASDPDNRRVDAALGALDGLRELATGAAGSTTTVEVALAAFANEFEPTLDWTEVGGDDDDLVDGLEAFRERNTGTDTDFVNALAGARESLAEQAATVTSNQPVCKAVLLFTDGGYDVGVRRTEDEVEQLGLTKDYAPGIELTDDESVQAVEQAGREAMCEPDGLADQLRGDDITLLTLALSVPGEDSGIPERSLKMLAAMNVTKVPGFSCGTFQQRAPGAFLEASEADVLIARFDEVATRLAGGTQLPGPPSIEVCDGDDCRDSRVRFELDASLRRAHLLALAPKAGATVELSGPGGTVTISEAGTVELGDVQIQVTERAGRGLAIDMDRPDPGEDWDGEWTVSIADRSGAQVGDQAIVQVFGYSSIGVQFATGVSLTRGQTSEVTAELLVPDAAAGSTIEEAAVVARFRDPLTEEVRSIDLAGPPLGPFTGDIDISEDVTANAYEVTLELRATNLAGATIVSQGVPQEVGVRRPAGSVQFGPPSLELPSLTGRGSTSATLIVIGGDAPGCIWFGPTETFSRPDGVESVVVTADGAPLASEDDCLEVGAGERLNLEISADPGTRAAGTVSGALELHEEVEGHEATTTQLGFRFDMARSVDQARRLVLAFALLAGGLAIPLLLLLIINSISARFQDLDAVRGAVVPVAVQGSVVERLDRHRPLALTLTPADFGSLSGTGSTKRFSFGGVQFWARASRNPFGATIALAVPEGGAEKLKGNEGSRIELDPGLAGSWVFLLDADRSRHAGSQRAVGTLIAFVAEGDAGLQAGRLLPDIERRLPDTATRLAHLVRKTTGKPPKAARSSRRAKGSPAPVEDAPPVDDAELGVRSPIAPPDAGPAAPPAGSSSSGPAADDDPDDGPPVGFGGRRA